MVYMKRLANRKYCAAAKASDFVFLSLDSHVNKNVNTLIYLFITAFYCNGTPKTT
jgi:hypothetical protein